MREEATDSVRSSRRASASLSARAPDLEAEARQGGFGFADVGGDPPIEDDLAVDQRIGQVGLVVTGAAVLARQTGARVADPVALDNLGHIDSLIKVTE